MYTGSLYVEHFNSQFDPQPFPDKSTLDDSYRGYSVIFGEFNGDDMPDVAAGLPRAPDHKGQVSLTYNVGPFLILSRARNSARLRESILTKILPLEILRESK